MICPDCGTDNIAGADLCSGCGSDLGSLDLPSADSEFTAHVLHDRLGDIVAEEPPVVAPSDPVGLAIHLMQLHNTGCVVVQEQDVVVGIITERDVLLKAASDKDDLNALTAGQIMTPDPVTLRDEDSLAVALHKMSMGEFRHIPLVTQDRVTHVVSIKHLLRHVSPFIPQSAPDRS